MLVRSQIDQIKDLLNLYLFRHERITVAFCIGIYGKEAVEASDASDSPELIIISSHDVDSRLFEQRCRHLRCGESPPDQVIKFVLIFRQIAFDRIRCDLNVRRSYSLVSVLCALFLFEISRLIRQVAFPERRFDMFANR